MRRNNRTPFPPLFTVDRPVGANWTWEVTYKVASSGYPTGCHVSAVRWSGEEYLVGIASCDLSLYDDLRQAIEVLAIEAMMAACEPQLDGSPTSRFVVLSQHL